jgi:uncharacterized protein YdcH (DUF465 family)
MDALRKAGDSVGAEVTVVARGVPVGWGDPVYDRLDADIAYAMMGINAVKGVEIGAGFRSVTQKGSEHGDELTPQGFLGNNAGGVLGGISTGQEVVVRMAVKPTSSIRLPRKTINVAGEATEISTLGRHDPCVGIRATPIAEAMLALVLIDAALRHRAQCADVAVRPRRFPGRPQGNRLIRFSKLFQNLYSGQEIMRVDHHDLYTEFPDMRDAIDALKAEGGYIGSLFGRYNRLTGKVEDLEEHDMPVGDFTIEDMKKARVKLKDEIYHLLVAFRAGQKHKA